MARATTCHHAGKAITIAEALELRTAARKARTSLRLECIECAGRVRAHAASQNGMAAHFEHISWREAKSANCSRRQADSSR